MRGAVGNDRPYRDSLIGGLGKERLQRTTQVTKLVPDTFIELPQQTAMTGQPERGMIAYVF